MSYIITLIIGIAIGNLWFRSKNPNSMIGEFFAVPEDAKDFKHKLNDYIKECKGE